MEVDISFPEHPGVKDTLLVNKKIGSGKFNVYQVFSQTYEEVFAFKVFPKNVKGITQFQKEKLMLSLDHPNVIQSIPIYCHREDINALLIEYAKHGDFFSLVKNGVLKNEAYVRTYFRQLIEGMEYIHSQGVAHLDLKLENLMLGGDLNLKIIDFDQAQLLSDKAITSGGSKRFRAPEVQTGTCKNLAAADIYSAGIILYAMKAQEFPFLEENDPENEDPKCYSTFVKNNSTFWKKKKEAAQDRSFFSKSFIELVNSMLHFHPSKRKTIQEIKASEWYKGEVVNAATLKKEIKAELKALREQRRKEKAENSKEKC